MPHENLKQFNARIDSWTPKGTLEGPTKKDLGDPVSIFDKALGLTREVPNVLRYQLPLNYCPECNKTDITRDQIGAKGGWCFNEDYVDLGIKPGDTVLHYKCSPCVEAEIWGRNSLILPDGTRKRVEVNRQALMQRNIIEFIRAERLRGNHGVNAV